MSSRFFHDSGCGGGSVLGVLGPGAQVVPRRRRELLRHARADVARHRADVPRVTRRRARVTRHAGARHVRVTCQRRGARHVAAHARRAELPTHAAK